MKELKTPDSLPVWTSKAAKALEENVPANTTSTTRWTSGSMSCHPIADSHRFLRLHSRVFYLPGLDNMRLLRPQSLSRP